MCPLLIAWRASIFRVTPEMIYDESEMGFALDREGSTEVEVQSEI